MCNRFTLRSEKVLFFEKMAKKSIERANIASYRKELNHSEN